MKKRYPILFKKFFYAIAALIAAVAAASITLNAIKFSGSEESFSSVDLPLDIAATVLMSLILVGVALLVFNSHYTFGERKLTVVTAFIPVSISYESMLLLREDIKNGMLVLYFAKKKDPDDVGILQFATKARAHADIVADIRKRAPHVKYELFDKYDMEA